jgi:hypothetical protein
MFVEKGKSNGKFAQILQGHHSQRQSVGEKIGPLVKGKLKIGHKGENNFFCQKLA